MSELKRYLDQLANGPLLDSVVSPGRYLQPSEPPEGEPYLDGERLMRRRKMIEEAYRNQRRRAPPRRRKTRKPEEPNNAR